MSDESKITQRAENLLTMDWLRSAWPELLLTGTVYNLRFCVKVSCR